MYWCHFSHFLNKGNLLLNSEISFQFDSMRNRCALRNLVFPSANDIKLKSIPLTLEMMRLVLCHPSLFQMERFSLLLQAKRRLHKIIFYLFHAYLNNINTIDNDRYIRKHFEALEATDSHRLAYAFTSESDQLAALSYSDV